MLKRFNTEQYYTIASSVRGFCYMSFLSVGRWSQIISFDVYTHYSFAGYNGANTAIAGTPFYYEASSSAPSTLFEVLSTVTCQQGDAFDQLITVNSAELASFLVPATVAGECVVRPSQAAIDSFYASEPFTFTVTGVVAMQMISTATPLQTSTITLLIRTADYTAVTFVLTLTCARGGSVSMEVTSATNSADYFYYQLPYQMSGDCLFTQSQIPSPYAPTTASIEIVPIGPLYYFPMERVVEWSRVISG